MFDEESGVDWVVVFIWRNIGDGLYLVGCRLRKFEIQLGM